MSTELAGGAATPATESSETPSTIGVTPSLGTIGGLGTEGEAERSSEGLGSSEPE